MASPVVNSEAEGNVVLLQRRRVVDPRALVPTVRTLIERLAGTSESDPEWQPIFVALVDAAVASHSAQNKTISTGLYDRISDITTEAASLLTDLTWIGERDVQHRYLGEDVGDYRYSADAALAVEQRINCDLDDLACYWLGLS